MRPVIDFQHIFHGGDERRAGLGRNDELLFQVRFENVFLASARSFIADALDDIQRHDFVFQQTQGPSRAPFRRLRTAQGDQFRLPGAIEDARSGGGGECLRSSTASKPSSTNCRRVRAMLARPVFSAEAIRLSLQASPAGEASTCNRMRAFVSFCAGCLPPWIKLSNCSPSSALSFTTYFFNPDYG